MHFFRFALVSHFTCSSVRGLVVRGLFGGVALGVFGVASEVYAQTTQTSETTQASEATQASETTPAAPTVTATDTAPATDTATGTATTANTDTTDTAADVVTEHEKAGRCITGSELACMSLTRTGDDGKERRIMIVRTGTTDDTGIYTICGPQEDEPEGAPNMAVFSESEKTGIRITIDKNVVRVPLAIVTQKPPKDDESGSDGKVNASAGTAQYLDNPPEGATDRLARCAVGVSPKEIPDTVFVSQGKTRLKGKKLVYDESDGIARIDGPITFERQNQQDPLSGTSERIEIDVDKEKTLLVGNVRLKSSGGRVSKASRAEYDDRADTARLFGVLGQPAESVKPDTGDIVRVTKGYLKYDLTHNEVVIRKSEGGNIDGTIPGN